jgi:putative DNA primase/helicase
MFWTSRFDGRQGDKTVLPLSFCQHADGQREWRWMALPEPRPIYNLDKLAANPGKPVLVCEGEKAAEAASQLFPDFVATTSPNGAKSAGKADWKPLAGHPVVIWPDHDDGGNKYAAAVARFAREAGATSVTIVKVPTQFPNKWDLADIPPEGFGGRELEALLAAAAPVVSQNASSNAVKVPRGFSMTSTGLYFDSDDSDAPQKFIAAPFNVLAQTRDDRGESWGLLLQWDDPDGASHQWALPVALLAGEGIEIRQRLLDGGLALGADYSAKKLLAAFLGSIRTANRARCVEAMGWYKSVYVTPGEVFGDSDGETIVLQSAGAVADFACRGTMSGWQEKIAAPAVGNSRLALAISAAFAGPLLHLMGEESFGFNFSGVSSCGKTTALRCAGSVWGLPLQTWRTTDNAAEGLARRANDGLLLLDELSQADARSADAMAYMLGNGQGKGRMRKDITNRPAATWRLVFLSTGEVGLAEKIGEVGKTARAGQSVRMIEIPADAGAGHKLFETLHGHANGDGLARHLRDATEHQCGHVIRGFLKKVAANPDAAVEKVTATKGEWLKSHLPCGADGQVSRVAARFALVAAAGELAIDLGLLPWPHGEADNAAAICFSAWIDQRGGVGSAEKDAGLAQVRAFIEAHGASRFTDLSIGDGQNSFAVTTNRVGFRRKTESGRWQYLVLPELWKKEVCRGQDAKSVARDLIAQRLLLPDGAGKSSRPELIPGFGKTRVYVLSPDILEKGS